MQMIRSFIALEISPEIQAQLGQIQNQLKKSDADVKWVNPQNIHLTLKFLGNVSPEMIEQIKKVITKLSQEHKHFELKITQLGAFPTIEHPRVLWVGIEQGFKPTIQLAKDLEERLIQLGFLREKRAFTPHLTLGRVRSNQNRKQLKQLLHSITFHPQTMPVQTIILFKSTLTPKGALYQPLYQTQLS
jgi:2'-5' RNA ligase